MRGRLRTIATRAVLAVTLALVSGLSLGVARPSRAPAALAAGGGGRLGVVADVGTRYGIYGRQGGPIGVLADTGAGWVKEEFRWDWVEPSRDRWTWAFMDEAVNDERAKGLQILGLLDYTAGWAVGSGDPVSSTPPPADLWATYVAQTVGRYKGNVHVWEVWNEPNMPVFWSGSKEQYAQLLALTYDTIKRVDPGATVLGPTITGVDEGWLDAIDWAKIDGLGLHLYIPPATLNDQGYSLWSQGLPNLQRIVAVHGGKPIWVTEFGYSSGAGGEAWDVGDEGLQARYLAQEAAELLAYTGLDVRLAMSYDFNDDTSGGSYGLLRHDWSSRKPAFAAFQTVAALLGSAQPGGRFDAGTGVLAFRFNAGDKQVDVVWAPGGGTAVIPAGGAGDTYDLYGKRGSVALQGGTLQVAVGADPVYVVHAPQAGSALPHACQPAGMPGGGAMTTFAATGKSAGGLFLAYWQAHGGLAVFGYPISDVCTEQLEDGQIYTVQYFERARFEYHPENSDPQYQVLLGQFGRALHPADPPAQPKAGALYFAQTGHNLGGGFRQYWQANGGLAQFGYPITEEFTEQLENGQSYTVQYFERARFEYHPENPAPYDILLGQFGRFVYAERVSNR
ncbi:MAG TPA: hypothetical protein VFL91_26745 [Thermomicrobiales bacterium]|nr:hypothetical protein [Thermomicrobiales bacterium]